MSQRTKSVIAANPSILSGDIGIANNTTDNAYHVVLSINDDNKTIFDGFRITKGNAKNANVALTDAITVDGIEIFRNCGGGFYNESSSVSISNCGFLANNSNYYGGGMYNNLFFSTISNCSF